MRIVKRVKGGSEGGEGFNDVLLRRDALDATCTKYRCCFFFFFLFVLHRNTRCIEYGNGFKTTKRYLKKEKGY